MRNTETGEFELTVGNRQLLSGFFIVVLLFAVAFAMGYVVGQNVGRSTKLPGDTAAAAVPIPNEARPQASSPAPPPAAVPSPADAGTQPPVDTSAPPPAAAPPVEAPKEAAKILGRGPDRPAIVDEIPVLAELPGPSGSFWQVVALPQSDAEVFAATLKKKGFPTFLSPGTKGLMRVMVGPYRDTAGMGRAKADLAAAGFSAPIRK